MSDLKTSTITLGNQVIELQTGLLAAQSSGAVTARCGDTIVLAVVTMGALQPALDYFPLVVEYREKLYAGGRIKSSRFVKREGRPSDEEILTSRLIDRSIRPLFPESFRREVQIIVTPLSIDGQNDPAILGIIATSAALSLSPIPFAGPVGSVRMGYVSAADATAENGLTPESFMVNPVDSDLKYSDLDLVVSGTNDFISMVEAGANEVSETVVLQALQTAQEAINQVIAGITDLVSQAGRDKLEVESESADQTLVDFVKEKAADFTPLIKAMAAGDHSATKDIVAAIVADHPEVDPKAADKVLFDLVKAEVRRNILDKGVRPDGRGLEDIRPITAEVGLLPRTHGSAFFRRGLTHALSVVTLGSPGRELLIEGMEGDSTKRYIHEYNMPPYASGETGRLGWPGRREIGHGALAERALVPVLPAELDFPYTIRVVTEIMSSNGSTSQASICASTLSLMDAGVPIKKPVAGIAMGLITDGKGKHVTLTDILGLEDHLGDMDFKVAGTADGVTAIQMDVKVKGITTSVLEAALEQARRGRLHILKIMSEAIAEPRQKLSQYAPRIVSFTIDPEKIGSVIGPGGKVIRQIQAETGVEIDIEDSGTVSITGTDAAGVDKARAWVESITAEAEVGKIYQGKVTRVQPFGAFVEILPGKEGLVHVSQLVGVNAATLKPGDILEVRLYEVDSVGRLNLTMNLTGDVVVDRPPRRPKPRFSRFNDRR